MIKLCILFQRNELTLGLKHPPEVKLDGRGAITGVVFHPEDEKGAHEYLRYIRWDAVEAVVQYEVDETKKEAKPDGKETG